MPLVGLPPAFVPPVVAVPAANAIVPFVAGAGAAGGGAAVASTVAAPLLVGALAGVAVLGIAYGVAQIWGALNSTADLPPGYVEPSATASTVGWVEKPQGSVGQLSLIWSSPAVAPTERTITAPSTVERITVVRNYFSDMPWPGGTGWSHVALGFDAAGNQMWSETFKVFEPVGYALFDGPGPNPLRLTGIRYFNTPAGEPAVELQPGTSLVRQSVTTLPLVEPVPAKAPPVTVPLPYAPPAAPEPEPLTQPAPARPARPVVAPPVTRPAPVTPAATPRTTTPTTPAGQVQPASQVPPTKTPTTVHVVNGTQIPANGPQPTPQGIAQELGRIESKLARLIDPKSDRPGQPPDRLHWLQENIANIIDFFLSINGGGEYRISSPCVLDEEGNRIESVVEYSGALQSFGVISNKIDALAQLLQEHKDLKQPICRETPATGGQAVTVNFVQVD